ncbi:MAG: Cytochrome oxidase assembly [Verrucomicrobiales bacterium]|nr:Cytochrome oxidase assembly [Verrucomicrobiales bacterium]
MTSKGVGMSVPDWPTTYGYNMFFFPISKWVGGVFWEHSHRLTASAVGFMTVILTVWLWLKESRAWMRWLGVAALFGVIAQGVLGGLRVTLYKDELGIFHATLAQLFLVLVSSIALFSARWWVNAESREAPVPDQFRLRHLYLAVAGCIFLQLILGATMRHQHAGLAIPDFPTAYGKVWPDMNPAAIEHYNQNRGETVALNPITAFQIVLQMVHRVMALVIFLGVAIVAWLTRRQLGWRSRLTKLAMSWFGLLCLQVVLGAATIWSNKSADIATTHVAVGALSLLNGAILFLAGTRCLKRAETVGTSGKRHRTMGDLPNSGVKVPA